MKKVILSLIILFSISSQAQEIGAKQYAIDMFMSQIGINSGLNRGSEYAPITRTKHLVGHPFFLGAGWQYGNITYNNIEYKNIQLLYDIVNDEIVTSYGDKYLLLEKWSVSEFTINNHRFINILDSSQITPGFYEIIQDSPLMIRYTKNIQEEENMNEKENVVYSKNKYFTNIKGVYKKASKDIINKYKSDIKDEQ